MGVEAVEGRGYEPYEAARLYVSTIGVKKYIVAYGFYNIYDKGVVLDFSYVKGLLEQKYGMDYLGFDEDDGSHSFGNDDFIVVIWSKENYPNLAKFHLQNMQVSNR